MPNEVKLLPCPFCGGNAYPASLADDHWIECNSCGASRLPSASPDEAIAAWNTRPTTVVTDEVVERVARAIAAAEWTRDARLSRTQKHEGDTAERYAERSWGLWTAHAHSALASMPTVVTGEQPEDLGDHALPPSGLSPCGSQAKPAAAIARKGEVQMTEEQIKYMANRFLGWRLPENFHPDAGISFKPTFNDHMDPPMRHNPVGTNLFDATQAEAMVRFMVEGLS